MERIVTVNLPDLGEGVVEGEVIQWLKKVGDPLEQDEPVVIVMTDKATVELPSSHPGILKQIFWKVGEMAIKGQPLYSIQVEGEEEVVEKQVEKEKEVSCPIEQLKVEKKISETTLASPSTRHLAKQLGICLEEVAPSGKHGEVTEEDLKNHLTTKKPVKTSREGKKEGDRVIPLRGIQGAMAEAMAKSHHEIPQFTYVISFDAAPLKALKAIQKTTFMPFYIKALALASQEFPLINSSLNLEEKEIYLHPSCDLGIAMDTSQGLVLPVLKGVETLSFSELVMKYESLKKGAKEGTLTPDAMRGATLSLSNFGTLGGLFGTPLVPYPQVAILGIGKIEEYPRLIEGRWEVGWRQYLSLSCDHRIIDGSLAAKVASFLTTLLTDPERLLER